MENGLYIGIMSGTSMDGIDASLVEFHSQGHRHLASNFRKWPQELQLQLRSISQPGDNEIEKLGVLDARVADEFAQCALDLLKQAEVNPQQVEAIGSHGQTVRHRPEATIPFTLQIGDANRIAEQTGITTVADFRRRDMAAGGQGAPLVCAFHEAMFHDNSEARVILNIGGIANITILPADTNTPVSGFDTGPGNTLLDSWTRKHLHVPYDESGSWAAGGHIEIPLLEELLRDDYLNQAPPKSTGPEYFNLEWLESILAKNPNIEPQDIQSTLLEFSVNSIARAIVTEAPGCSRVIVCGGGVHNQEFMKRLRRELENIQLDSCAEYGIDPNQVEAIAFAWLARQTLLGLPGNIPGVTGASGHRVLGGIYLATTD
jgi:anhydro-N-acetylmuramic acid kinase